jgi:hypothetical protein
MIMSTLREFDDFVEEVYQQRRQQHANESADKIFFAQKLIAQKKNRNVQKDCDQTYWKMEQIIDDDGNS